MTMVYVRMLIDIQGPRNGVDWPRRGELALITVEEAQALISSESATYHGPGPDESPPVERATVDDRETAAVETEPKRRGRPPKNTHEAARQSLTKQ